MRDVVRHWKTWKFEQQEDGKLPREFSAPWERSLTYREFLTQTDVVLTPAACYPLYPTCKGTLKEGGRLVNLSSFCFRHEPSPDPARMQMFRMREQVRLGEPEQVKSWRDRWIDRGHELMQTLGLDVSVVPASDPFFGRGGRMLAANQRAQHLKLEIIVPICSTTKPTAIMSFNYHQDHFGQRFGIRGAAGQLWPET